MGGLCLTLSISGGVLKQQEVFVIWYDQFSIYFILYAKEASCYMYHHGINVFQFKITLFEKVEAAQCKYVHCAGKAYYLKQL